MKMKKILSCLMLLCFTMTLSAAALAQDAGDGSAPIGERAFSAMLAEAFPGYRPDPPLTSDDPLTFTRALHALCGVIGMDWQTPAENLAFAIEHDMIPGIAAVGDSPVTRAEAQRMIEAFAGYVQEQIEEVFQDALRSSAQTVNLCMPAGAAPSPGPVSMAITTDWAMEMDYNSLNDESYAYTEENGFRNPVDSPFSTFALDVDTASYANIRRCLLGGYLPDVGAVRIEEMLNYFDYDLPQATASEPVAVTAELNVCPWNPEHQLAMIALNSYTPDKAELPGSNLVFLVDVSGSMEAYNRLPLARQALKLLVSQLTEKDTVSIVIYAGCVGTLLEPTSAADKETIHRAIDSMHAGGSTNGAGGIQAAYEKARAAYIDGGNNRVILLTDGDFNVGVQSASELEALIEGERDFGIYLSVLGFGMGNLKDYEMETLADTGNGNYAYIDTLKEAKKVMVDDMTATIYTVAKDVKLQVEFHPQTVASYRLIGYENRMLDTEDFTDDTKDAGEMGAGHQMIALYEIVPAAGETTVSTTTSRYQESEATGSDETLYVSVRCQLPQSGEILQTGAALTAPETFGPMSADMAFASAVAAFGMLLEDSEYKAGASLQGILELAAANRGEDPFGYRAEFVQLVSLTGLLAD